MTYIWNRAERVNEKFMPDAVIGSFKKWKKNLTNNWDDLPEAKRHSLQYRINREHRKMNESLVALGHEPYNK